MSDFAEKIGMTRKDAKNLETVRQRISYDTVQHLSSVLGLDPSVFAKFVLDKEKPTDSKLGQLVRAHRKKLAMSLRQLAKALGVSHQFISQIEHGQQKLTKSDELIKKLAQILQLDVSRLYTVKPT